MGRMKVYVTEITHEHGCKIFLNRTYRGAPKNLDFYVTQNWDCIAGFQENVPRMPDDIHKRIVTYFESLPLSENYTITRQEIGD